MRFKRLAGLGLAMATVAHGAAAHPGHPALSAAHSHAFFGGDPLYAWLLIAVAAVGVAVWRRARRRAGFAQRR